MEKETNQVEQPTEEEKLEAAKKVLELELFIEEFVKYLKLPPEQEKNMKACLKK